MADTPRRRQGAHFATSDSQPNTGAHSAPASFGATYGASRQTAATPLNNPYGQAGGYGQQAGYTQQGTYDQNAYAQGTTQNAYASQPQYGQQASYAQNTGAAGMQSMATPRSREQRKQDNRGGHSKKAPIIALVIALVVVVVAGVVVIPRVFGGSGETELENVGQEVEVVIEDGSGALAIASTLKEAGVIADADAFVTEVQKQGADSSLKSGAYVFTIGDSYDNIISLLTSGPNSTSNRLTIAEGLTVTQTAAAVESALGISADDFIAQAKASNYVSEYSFLANVSDDSLEGYLCPKTYDFSAESNLSADTVIRAMLNQYQTDVASLDFASGEATIKERYGIEMSDYDILKLASIIEREAVTAEQRPKVSSTFYNRLKIGMALQSDATMMYVTGGEVTAADLQTESPYNTYLNTGLTPTPICTPSVESIQAALAPDDTDYLYFYITQTDEWFSSTYDEHLQAIEENR